MEMLLKILLYWRNHKFESQGKFEQSIAVMYHNQLKRELFSVQFDDDDMIEECRKVWNACDCDCPRKYYRRLDLVEVTVRGWDSYVEQE